jgi:hypothetical protein
MIPQSEELSSVRISHAGSSPIRRAPHQTHAQPHGGIPMKTPTNSATPRLALSRNEAAASLGMSLRHFQRHVQPHIACIYSGQLRLYPIAELERWMQDQDWRRGTAA